ncbi:MAG: LamG-like jellyroll fold domain-containing protein [Calditrichaceae bacterium]
MKINLIKILPYMLTVFFVTGISQQIQISRIELMPNQPSPYKMRDWKKVTAGYDSLVFDFNRSGEYLPLIWWNENTVNYPEQISFGLHTVVGTNYPESSEAINVLPAVIGATLSGIDKSSQDGRNWVLMCEEFFNNRPEENVYLNLPVTESGDDWWYATMPNVFFYQLYDLYPNTGHFNEQFIKVADQWLASLKAMGGRTTPWKKPYMYYRGWYLSTMTPYASGVPEPEAAGALSWILYNAWTESGDEKYRIGAEWAMEYLNGLSANPSYELQLSYGAYTAARMNAELGTGYDTGKILNWCFNVGPLRSWGAIVGQWGNYRVDGLIGEVNYSNDYAFAMNTFEQIGALVPLVRYDDRFARAIGKWVLNAANSARLFYTNYLPDQNQDSEQWARQYDPNSYIAHEALRQSEFAASPYATGDAISGGWGKTNLALYGSSHVGIAGGIIDTTEIPMILKLDLLKTDYFHQSAYPSFLFYNPYSEEKTVTLDVGAETADLYDAVSNRFIQYSVSGQTNLAIPANQAIITVIVPAGGQLTYELDKMLVNGVVVDFMSGQAVNNHPPRIKSLDTKSYTIPKNEIISVYCAAEDIDQDSIAYVWKANSVTLNEDSSQIIWQAPDSVGQFIITCMAGDGSGGIDSASIILNVIEFINNAPKITALSADPLKVDLEGVSQILCAAADEDGDKLEYIWSSGAGLLNVNDSVATWQAPASEGEYMIRCEVRDRRGGSVLDSVGVLVRDYSAVQTGDMVGYYPFTGNPDDQSGFGNHGIVHGALLTADKFGDQNKAYRFDGIDDFIEVANHPSLNFTQAITVSFWIRISEFYIREAYPLSHGNWENRWKISVTDKKIRWTIKTDQGVKDLDSKKELQQDVYYQVTAVYDGAYLEIYVNGEMESFTAWSGPLLSTNYNLTIGQVLPDNKNYNFKGILDNIRIYNYALPHNEIQNLYNEYTPLPGDEEPEGINGYILNQSYPNPFNPRTTIRFYLPQRQNVKITIFDINGKILRKLTDESYQSGWHRIVWDGTNENRQDVSSGIYIYKIKSGDFIESGKMIKIK